MVLLCVGALINWLGLAENYVEPVRYVGVACIISGALLICAAMCCWLHAPPSRTSSQMQHVSHPITAQVRSRPSVRFQDTVNVGGRRLGGSSSKSADEEQQCVISKRVDRSNTDSFSLRREILSTSRAT